MFETFEFCLPTNATKVPAGPEWFHEIKQDGFRIRVERDGDRVRLITRGGYDWTKRYPWIAESALKNRIRQLQRRPAALFLRRYFLTEARSHSTQVALTTTRSATCPCLHGLPVKYRFSPFAFASALEMICMLVPCLSKPILRQNGSQEEGEVDYPGAYTRH